MKLRNLLIPVLLGVSLTACNEEKDYSGVYSRTNGIYTYTFTFTKNPQKNEYLVKWESNPKAVSSTETYRVENGEAKDVRTNYVMGKFLGNVYTDLNSSKEYTKQ